MPLTHTNVQDTPSESGKPQYHWPDVLLQDGKMAELIYHFDWSQTNMGPLESWPQSLRTMVSAIVSNSFPMIILWGDDYYQFYNDAFIPIAGHNHPSMLGTPCRETWSEIWDTIVLPIFTHVRETRKPMLIENQHFPVLRFGYLEEVYCLTAYSALYDDQGTAAGVLMTITETTAQVLGERRLQTLHHLGAGASEARRVEDAYDIISETLGKSAIDIPFSLIYMLDEAGTQASLVASAGIDAHEQACPAMIDLSEPDEDRGWPLHAVFASGAAYEVNDLATRFGPLPGGPWPESPRAAVILPIKLQTQERPVGFLVASISPRRELDDHYREFLTLVTAQATIAISNAQAYEQERKRSEALAELDRAKTAFFSNVSHEFRTPLTLMLGPLEELLAASQSLPPEAREPLAMVYRNGLRLLRLVNSLLDFSRIEAGRVQASYQPTDLAAYTADLASIFQSAMDKAGLTLSITCSPLREPVYVDREMWEKIVLNLLSNAFKFTFQGGISVQLSENEGQVQLLVQDTGTGIAPEELPKVFERFHRVKGAESRTYEGTGIGLSLVQELAKLHGGSVSVQSTPEQGSVFKVSLPFGVEHLPPDRIGSGAAQTSLSAGPNPFVEEALRWLPDAPVNPMADFPTLGTQTLEGVTLLKTPSNSSAKPRIVLADDNLDMLAYVKRLLEPLYEVVAVPDGEAAWDAIRQAPPDLLLTDIMMPALDGFGLLQRIRADVELQTLPVIMLSARAGEEANIEGLDAGADDYLVKPFSAKELLARVRSNLEMARIRRESEMAMRQAQKMQVVGQLAGGVAHDFNSLLTVLVGNLKLLEAHVHDEAGHRMLNAAFRATEKTSSLTKQLLAFARKQRLERRVVNLNDLVLGIDDLLTRTLGGIVRVETHLADDLRGTFIDPNQVELGLLNLAINARDAMPEGGVLVIETRNVSYGSPVGDLPPGEYVSLTVSDTGTGMEPAVLAQVFDPFFTTKEVGKGTGLGLSQVHGVVKQLGGTVMIRSELGQGTTVEILLPCSTQPPPEILAAQPKKKSATR